MQISMNYYNEIILKNHYRHQVSNLLNHQLWKT